MFDKSWVGYASPSLTECLGVFAMLFLAGSVWTMSVNRYVSYRTGQQGGVR